MQDYSASAENHTPTTRALDFRARYPEFIFESFKITQDIDGLHADFLYRLDAYEFHPSVDIPAESIRNQEIDQSLLEKLFFNFGIINAINYYKLTCAPKFIIRAGTLDKLQEFFFKKLFYHGLGEFMYLNELNLTFDEFLKIECQAAPAQTTTPSHSTVSDFSHPNPRFTGNLIPVGGGKDSVVTLETLQPMHHDNLCFQFNRSLYPTNRAALDCIRLAGYPLSRVVNFNLNFDPKILELNQQGFLNGHVPFSSMLAFASLIAAYLNNKTYIVLSNEASANEGNVAGTTINHQYSKSFEFENDFQNYATRYLTNQIHYFSLLRCLNEYTIVQRFLKTPLYLNVFRSCNVGTKSNSWCGHCAKCLYVFLMFYPFVEHAKLNQIFGHNLFTDASLLQILIGLVDPSTVKPFDCVGTREEINYALSLALQSTTTAHGHLIDEDLEDAKEHPLVLLEYFRDHYYRPESPTNITRFYNPNHHIPPQFLRLIAPEHAQ